MKKPKGQCAKWSDTQVAQWIKFLVSQGRVAFDDAGHAERRSEQRLTSYEEMLTCVKRGLAGGRESGVMPTGKPSILEERMTFQHRFASRPQQVTHVVAAISDAYEDCVLITIIQKRKR